MEPFTIQLSNGETVAGIHIVPTGNEARSLLRPLIVGLHGGSYECHYFDADPNHTASISSLAYKVPFVSIDRPCYGGTTSFLPLPEGSKFIHESAIRLHNFILPALWSKFGAPNDCNCIVLLNHSLGVMMGVATAALHSQDENPSYPLGGIICSGLGDVWLPHMIENHARQVSLNPSLIKYPPDAKDATMFLPGTVRGDILRLTEHLNHPMSFAEVRALPEDWLVNWHEWAADVQVPVFFSLVEKDSFFVTSEERLKSCAEAFSNSRQVESTMMKYAPHCVELSLWSQAWYARCFGFALECSINLGFQKTNGGKTT